jgi:Ni/Co efflux regulator RcnB
MASKITYGFLMVMILAIVAFSTPILASANSDSKSSDSNSKKEDSNSKNDDSRSKKDDSDSKKDDSHSKDDDSDSEYGYGGGNEKITVCKATGSRFNPYVKVTVPKSVGQQFLHDHGVLPDKKGNCPKGISIADYIRELYQKYFHSNAYAKDDNNSKGQNSKDNNSHSNK